MLATLKPQKTAICPFCRKSRIILESSADTDVTIVCTECNGHYSIDLTTLRTTKKRSAKKNEFADNDTTLSYKLKCPHGCKHYILYDNKVDALIGGKCSVCDRYFRGNLLTGRTWATKAQRS